jgi:imidazolonepropionase-like amidohydrolase
LTAVRQDDPEILRRVWAAAWWPAAKAVVVEAGLDCTVLDPDADADLDFWDGDPLHGIIQVRRHTGLGWIVMVSETETEEGE